MRDFNHTVGVLVRAYMNDTLQHGNCAACAVGNIIADSCGFEYEPRKWCSYMLGWKGLTNRDFMSWYIEPKNDGNADVRENDLTVSTGYSTDELKRIENTFEKHWTSEDRMFNSLCAVVDVLAEIHRIDLTEKESAKALFVKA